MKPEVPQVHTTATVRDAPSRAWRLALAEEDAALGLRCLRGLHDLHHHRLGGHAEMAHDGLGDVLAEAALLLDRAAFDGVDDDLGHGSPPSAVTRETILGARAECLARPQQRRGKARLVRRVREMLRLQAEPVALAIGAAAGAPMAAVEEI